LEDYCHSLDRRHFVLVGILNFTWRDSKHRSGYNVGRASREPGHGVVRLSADCNYGLVFNLQQDQFEPSQSIACTSQLPTKRRHLYSVELERAVREEKLSVHFVIGP